MIFKYIYTLLHIGEYPQKEKRILIDGGNGQTELQKTYYKRINLELSFTSFQIRKLGRLCL